MQDDSDRVTAQVVDRNGKVVSTDVVYSSTNPSLVSVDNQGRISSTSGTMGSCSIKITFGNLAPAFVTVAVGKLGKNTIRIGDSIIRDWNPQTGILILQQSTITDALQVGNVILSGFSFGIMNTITEISDIGEGIVSLKTVPATLTETYEELKSKLEITSQEFPFTEARSKALDNIFEYCEVEGDISRPEFEGAGASQILELSFVADVDISLFTVNTFSIYALAKVGFSASTGSITIGAAAEAEVTCSYEFNSLVFPVAAIPGTVIYLGPSLTPSVGIKLGAEFDGPSITFRGPSIEDGYLVKSGVGYTDSSGFDSIWSKERFGSGLTWGGVESNFDAAFNAMIEPFISSDFGVSADVGCCVPGCPSSFCLDLAQFELAVAEVAGGAEFGISTPLSRKEFEYTGPNWASYVRLYGGLDPVLNYIDNFETLLRKIGIQTNFEIDPTLFEARINLAESPKPQVLAADLDPDENWTITVASEGSKGGTATVLSFSSADDEGNDVGQGSIKDGEAAVQIGNLSPGLYILKAQQDSIFGSLFPYASTGNYVLNTAEPDVPDPPEPRGCQEGQSLFERELAISIDAAQVFKDSNCLSSSMLSDLLLLLPICQGVSGTCVLYTGQKVWGGATCVTEDENSEDRELAEICIGGDLYYIPARLLLFPQENGVELGNSCQCRDSFEEYAVTECTSPLMNVFPDLDGECQDGFICQGPVEALWGTCQRTGAKRVYANAYFEEKESIFDCPIQDDGLVGQCQVTGSISGSESFLAYTGDMALTNKYAYVVPYSILDFSMDEAPFQVQKCNVLDQGNLAGCSPTAVNFDFTNWVDRAPKSVALYNNHVYLGGSLESTAENPLNPIVIQCKIADNGDIGIPGLECERTGETSEAFDFLGEVSLIAFGLEFAYLSDGFYIRACTIDVNGQLSSCRVIDDGVCSSETPIETVVCGAGVFKQIVVNQDYAYLLAQSQETIENVIQDFSRVVKCSVEESTLNLVGCEVQQEPLLPSIESTMEIDPIEMKAYIYAGGDQNSDDLSTMFVCSIGSNAGNFDQCVESPAVSSIQAPLFPSIALLQ